MGAVKYDIKKVVTEGFGDEILKHDQKTTTEIVNSFLPVMDRIAQIFVRKNENLIYDEIISYAYIAATAAVYEYNRNDGEFDNYVTGYIISSIKKVTKSTNIEIPTVSLKPTNTYNADWYDEISGICLEVNYSKIEEKNKAELLSKAKQLLESLDTNESAILNPIITGKVSDPKNFSNEQQKTLIKLRKEL